MSNTETTPQAVAPLSQEQILAALLEVTGDLDTALVLEKTLPAWLTKAAPAMIATLDKTVREFQTCQAKVDLSLRRLQPLHTFCVTELTQALVAR